MNDNEYRVFGPPGCGKTTYLSKQIEAAVERRGSESVLVASLTKAAANEVVGRGLPVERKQIGTLHAHAFRALGHPKLVHDKGGVELWNDWTKKAGMQTYAMTDVARDHVDGRDSMGSGTDGDKLLESISVYRSRGIDPDMWPVRERRFSDMWTRFKAEQGLMDFTDLIENAFSDVWLAPGNPSVIFVDEAQDMDRLSMNLVRRWSSGCDKVIIVGDPDQNLYRWRGTDSQVFVDPPIPDDRIRVLEQSYRVPVAVHALATKWIAQHTGRMDVVYHPRPFDGEARSMPQTAGSWKDPEYVLADAQQYLTAGKSVMFLASCSFHLQPVIQCMRDSGIPFHNPYKPDRGDWNPLGLRARACSMSQRILSFLAPDPGHEARMWTAQDLAQWIHPMNSRGILNHGYKTEIENIEGVESSEVSLEFLIRAFAPQALDRALALDIQWWQDNLMAAKKDASRYPLKILANLGPKALETRPQIVVSTIHACKGGEADVVYLFPDLSPSGYRQWANGQEERNDVIRQFYVGITRARESLILCSPKSSSHVDIRRFL